MSIIDRFRLDGKKAFVTGASKGIGKGYAVALLEAGADVAIIARDYEATKKATEEIAVKGSKVIPIGGDVSKPEDVQRMLAMILDEFGTIDIAVNNAGICINKSTEMMTLDEWQHVMDVNLTGVFLAAKGAAEVMIKNGGGSIINTCSMAAHIIPEPQYHCAYSASKAGLLHFTKSLAAELAPYNIRVNCISPGYTVTELTKDVIKPSWYERVPMHKVGSPEDLQGALLYFASSASAYTTGEDLLVDGGFCCW
ncbi:MAG: glucose 1-dehydrogenase [Eubacteriales bacterium]|nr:glucose 1-dehydrogenase [Eubacteriales bacterium]